jgi:hypothetical protein
MHETMVHELLLMQLSQTKSFGQTVIIEINPHRTECGDEHMYINNLMQR